jgi:hypothetical protein
MPGNTSRPSDRSSYERASTINSEHHSNTKWLQRMVDTDARLVVSFGGIKSELTVNILADTDNYEVLIPAVDVHAGQYSERDYPFYSAFCMHTNYRDQLKNFYTNKSLDSQTTLVDSLGLTRVVSRACK